MSSVNQIPNRAFAQLRTELIFCRKQIQHFKNLYSAECKNFQKAHKALLARDRENMKLMWQMKQLKSKLKKYQVPDHRRKSRKLKDWNQINCDRTKRRRVQMYRDIILCTLRQIDSCHRAEISLWIHTNQIKYSFAPKDFQRDDTDLVELGKQNNTCLNSDHMYSKTMVDVYLTEDYADINYSEIFDDDGSWKKEHIRKLVYVLDSFRISHEAYHELRMVSKGHLPAIGRIIVEKTKMSQVLKHIKHPTDDAIRRDVRSVLEYLNPPALESRRYILKFATDRVVLTNTKNAVQGTMKLIPADKEGKVLMDHNLPSYFEKEVTLYYYIGTETYDNQVRYGEQTFSQLEQLRDEGFSFHGIHHDIDLVCCSDWKAGACIEGLNSATAKYFCRYCYCTKEEINDLKEIHHWPIERTYKEHIRLMNESKMKKGCIRKPVMCLEPTQCPPDMLHMKKAIISKLLNQVFDWVILQGKEDKLMDQMREDKIPFTKRADGSNSGVKWTCPNIHDLMDILDKVKIELVLDNVFDKRLSKIDNLSVVQLRKQCASMNLPKNGNKADLVNRIKMVLGDEAQIIDWRKSTGKEDDNKSFVDVSALKKLWSDLKILISSLKEFNDIDTKLKEELYSWGLQYMSTTFDKDITPYIHVFVYHSYYFAEKFGYLKAIEMEAVEQLNYINKLVFFGASNHGRDDFTITEQIMRHSTRGLVAAVENLKITKRHYSSRH